MWRPDSPLTFPEARYPCPPSIQGWSLHPPHRVSASPEQKAASSRAFWRSQLLHPHAPGTSPPPQLPPAPLSHACPGFQAAPTRLRPQRPSSNLVLRLARAQGGGEGKAEAEPASQPEAKTLQSTHESCPERHQRGQVKSSLLPPSLFTFTSHKPEKKALGDSYNSRRHLTKSTVSVSQTLEK